MGDEMLCFLVIIFITLYESEQMWAYVKKIIAANCCRSLRSFDILQMSLVVDQHFSSSLKIHRNLLYLYSLQKITDGVSNHKLYRFITMKNSVKNYKLVQLKLNYRQLIDWKETFDEILSQCSYFGHSF